MNKYTEILFEVLAERGIEVIIPEESKYMSILRKHFPDMFPEIKRGEWLDIPDEWFNSVRCSRCQYTILKKDKTNYCGNCSADNRGLR